MTRRSNLLKNLNQAGGNESEVAGKFPNNSDTYHCSGVKIWALKSVLMGKPEEKRPLGTSKCR